MLPLALTLVLGLISFLCSAFIILRVIISTLPAYKLHKHFSSEFPDGKPLSPADKSHIWLASLDVLAVVIFVWQATTEYFDGATGTRIASHPAAAVRLWIAITLRQTCLLVVAALTLLQVRMGRSVSFGRAHWMLWMPTLLLVGISTTLTGVFASLGIRSYFWGLLGYSTFTAICSSAAFACLIGTLLVIRRNLATLHDMQDASLSAHAYSQEKPRQSFETTDVDALKDGDSWITSCASSQHDSISSFSFSTDRASQSNVSATITGHWDGNPPSAFVSHMEQETVTDNWPTSVASSRSFVDPSNRPRSFQSCYAHHDLVPSHRADTRPHMESRSSWLPEAPSGQSTLSSWSFPTRSGGTPCQSVTRSRPMYVMDESPMHAFGYSTGPVDIAQELGIARNTRDLSRIESGHKSSRALDEVDVSVRRAFGWMTTIWIPMVLALPYYITAHTSASVFLSWTEYLLVCSVTISSPLLAANLLLRSPLPIPSGLFDTPADPPSIVWQPPSLPSTFNHAYKRSGSVTVVEGRRSGDVWPVKGDVSEGNGKLSRGLSLIHPKPKLTIIPLDAVVLDNQSLPFPHSISTPDAQEPTSTMLWANNLNSGVCEAAQDIGVPMTQGQEPSTGSHKTKVCPHLMTSEGQRSTTPLIANLSPTMQRDTTVNKPPPAVLGSKAVRRSIARDFSRCAQHPYSDIPFPSSAMKALASGGYGIVRGNTPAAAEERTHGSDIRQLEVHAHSADPSSWTGPDKDRTMRWRESGQDAYSGRVPSELGGVPYKQQSVRLTRDSSAGGPRKTNGSYRCIDEPTTHLEAQQQSASFTLSNCVPEPDPRDDVHNNTDPNSLFSFDRSKCGSLDTLSSTLGEDFEVLPPSTAFDGMTYDLEPTLNEVAKRAPGRPKTKSRRFAKSTPSLPLSAGQTKANPPALRTGVHKLKQKVSKLAGLRRVLSVSPGAGHKSTS